MLSRQLLTENQSAAGCLEIESYKRRKCMEEGKVWKKDCYKEKQRAAWMSFHGPLQQAVRV